MKKLFHFKHYSKTSSSIINNELVRTRFAPSPTGFLHLGSLRTALYNYLLAKSSSNGRFILRIEDTDQKRLVKGAEQNIIDCLKWCNFNIDEGPYGIGGKFGPYKQSERKDIYIKYANQLLNLGLAYKCFCSKERLQDLKSSAKLLKPPTNVTYDRKCYNLKNINHDSNNFVIRFKSPDSYPSFYDELHGNLNLQPQYNYKDRRFDDFIIIKNDGMPTYHFANIIDDHLMKITHVIRGEEWLPSTSKHLALYKAFNWQPPKFIHIPLLTSLNDKKLSKRSGDLNLNILNLKNQGILPEALINFVSLFGWSPSRKLGEKFNEMMNMNQLIEFFDLKNLTKGNAKVNNLKLFYFNKLHLQKKFKDDFNQVVDECYPIFKEIVGSKKDKEYLIKLLIYLDGNLNNLNEVYHHLNYLINDINYSSLKIPNKDVKEIIKYTLDNGIEKSLINSNFKKKDIFMSLRFALSGNQPGLTIPQLLDLLDKKEIDNRLQSTFSYLNSCT
ncbi:unnamed protein product [Candida verbasci]|uniref:Glutamate--tRNA ligase, mitochondrial n=1 Tax=Candida verbasci TaxID=1227364 RepID=A0A9W4TQ50_9ASCO|nr:unnamed protein product [Candida verbasci]